MAFGMVSSVPSRVLTLGGLGHSSRHLLGHKITTPVGTGAIFQRTIQFRGRLLVAAPIAAAVSGIGLAAFATGI